MKTKYFISILFLYFIYYALGSYILNYNTSSHISNGCIISYLKKENEFKQFHFLMEKLNNIIEKTFTYKHLN